MPEMSEASIEPVDIVAEKSKVGKVPLNLVRETHNTESKVGDEISPLKVPESKEPEALNT